MGEMNGDSAAYTNGVKLPVRNGAGAAPPSYAQKHNIAAHFIGGNTVESAPPGPVKDFVTANGGHTVITNVSFLPLSSLLWDSWWVGNANMTCAGPHCKQRYCSRERDPLGAEMGI
jgi:hypothetical protein